VIALETALSAKGCHVRWQSVESRSISKESDILSVDALSVLFLYDETTSVLPTSPNELILL
jgi:hypothetical protein